MLLFLCHYNTQNVLICTVLFGLQHAWTGQLSALTQILHWRSHQTKHLPGLLGAYTQSTLSMHTHVHTQLQTYMHEAVALSCYIQT